MRLPAEGSLYSLTLWDGDTFVYRYKGEPGAMTVRLLLATRKLPHGSWWWRATVLGALNIGVFFALLFLAAYRLPGGIAAVLGAVQPLLTVGLAIPLLGQLPSGRALLGGVTGLFGVALVVLQATARLDAVGVLAGLGG